MPQRTHAQYWAWGAAHGAAQTDRTHATATDNLNFVYAAGTYTSANIIFDNITYTNQGSTDIFITKYTTDGALIWAKTIGTVDADSVFAIKTDRQFNIIIVGSTTSSSGDTDGFMTKMDSAGNILFTKNLNGTGYQTLRTLATDAQNNIILGGEFSSPTLPLATLPTLTNTGNTDAFILKLSPQGTEIYSRQLPGSGNEYAPAIATDAQNDIYLALNFTSPQINVANQNIVNSGNTDIIIIKYTATGAVSWFNHFVGSGNDITARIATDTQNNVYMCGYFDGNNINLGNGIQAADGTPATPAPDYNTLVAKLQASSGQAQWVKSSFGTKNDYAHSLSIVDNNEIWVTGTFHSPGMNIHNSGVNLVNFGGTDAYILCYSPTGAVRIAQAINSTGNDTGNDVAAAATGTAYVAGSFDDAVLGFGTFGLVGAGNADGFLAKYGEINQKPTAKFIMTDTTICAGTCIDFVNLSLNNPTNYKWQFTGANTDSTTTNNPKNICFAQVGNYTATLTAYNAYGSDNITAQIFVKPVPAASVLPSGSVSICAGSTAVLTAQPDNLRYEWTNGIQNQQLIVNEAGFYAVRATNVFGCRSMFSQPVQVGVITVPPTITKVCYVLIASVAQSYQWQFNNFDIAGATARSLQTDPKKWGEYKVITKDIDGCVGVSDGVDIGAINGNNLVNIAPNPSNDGIFYINYMQNTPLPVGINILNTLGQVVKTQIFDNPPPHRIDLQKMSSGVYVIKGNIEGCAGFSMRIVINSKF